MSGRIVTLQRGLRELGRLRAGQSVPAKTPGKMRPTASRTWILTSATRSYLEAAAELWGGQVDEWQPLGGGPKVWRVITEQAQIDAILPPGDPLSQAYELWSAGGCQRRCDGATESRSGKPCLCRAEFGDDFHQQDRMKVQVCQIHTRLNVFLPDLPDIGMYRVETHGFWPSNHISGYVDFIKAQVGPQVMVPVELRIEPRSKVADGKTSNFVEIVVQVRNAPSFGQIMAGGMQTIAIGGAADRSSIDGGPDRQQIEASPPDATPAEAAPVDVEALWCSHFRQAASLAELRAMWTPAGQAGALGKDSPARQVFWEMRAQFEGGEPAAEEAVGRSMTVAELPADDVPAEAEPDRDLMWTKAMSLAGERGWNTATVTEAFAKHTGKEVHEADGWALELFVTALQTGAIS